MTSFREMRFDDLFKINSLVFDALTEVYSLTFFVKHFLEFPGLSQIAIAPGPDIRVYISAIVVVTMRLCAYTCEHV